MKKLYFAKPKMSHDNFNKGNLYEIVSEIKPTDLFLQLKVKGEIVSAKKNNFEISECLFNDSEIASSNAN